MPLTNSKPTENIGPDDAGLYWAENAGDPNTPAAPSNSEKLTGSQSGQTYTSAFANWLRRLADRWIRFLYEVFSVQHADDGTHKDISVTNLIRKGGVIQIAAAAFQPYSNVTGKPTTNNLWINNGYKTGFTGTGGGAFYSTCWLPIGTGEYIESIKVLFERHVESAVSIGLAIRHITSDGNGSRVSIGSITTDDAVNADGYGMKVLTANFMIQADHHVQLEVSYYAQSEGTSFDHAINGLYVTLGEQP